MHRSREREGSRQGQDGRRSSFVSSDGRYSHGRIGESPTSNQYFSAPESTSKAPMSHNKHTERESCVEHKACREVHPAPRRGARRMKQRDVRFRFTGMQHRIPYATTEKKGQTDEETRSRQFDAPAWSLPTNATVSPLTRLHVH